MFADAGQGPRAIDYQQGTSSDPKDNVVSLVRSVIDGGENVFTFQESVIGKNFFDGRPGSEQFKNIRHTDAMTANAGTTSALAFFHRNSAKTFKVHDLAPKVKIRCLSHERQGHQRFGQNAERFFARVH